MYVCNREKIPSFLTYELQGDRKILLVAATSAHFPYSYCYDLNQVIKTITKNKRNGYKDLQINTRVEVKYQSIIWGSRSLICRNTNNKFSLISCFSVCRAKISIKVFTNFS